LLLTAPLARPTEAKRWLVVSEARQTVKTS